MPGSRFGDGGSSPSAGIFPTGWLELGRSRSLLAVALSSRLAAIRSPANRNQAVPRSVRWSSSLGSTASASLLSSRRLRGERRHDRRRIMGTELGAVLQAEVRCAVPVAVHFSALGSTVITRRCALGCALDLTVQVCSRIPISPGSSAGDAG